MSSKSHYHWNRSDYQYTDNTGWPNYTVTTGVGSFLTTMLDWRVGYGDPFWRRKIKAHQNATLPMTAQRRSVDSSVGGFFKLTDVWGDGSILQEKTHTGLARAPSFAAPSGDFTSADNAALKRILKRIKDQRTSFQGLTFLGELRESISMIKNPAKSFRQGIVNYIATAQLRSKGVKQRIKRKVLAETWLEYSFGWIPLISDIKEGVEAYHKHVSQEFYQKLTSRGQSSDSHIYEAGQRGSNANFVPLLADTKSITTQSVQYIVGLEYTCTGANPDVSVFERAGITFRDFVPTIWELVPYSFLVDYFTNIGDILEAGATSTSDVKWVCRTKRSTARLFQFDAPDTLKTQENRTVTGSPSYSATSAVNVERESPIPGFPKFEVSIPSSPTQWINMAALASGAKAVRQSFL
jgi:hypothetical protein